MYEFNEYDYRYPITGKNGKVRTGKNGKVRTGNKKAVIRSYGIPDANNLEKVIAFLNEPGSKARVKWSGDTKWTQYGDVRK